MKNINLRLMIVFLVFSLPFVNTIGLFAEFGFLTAQDAKHILELLDRAEENYYSGNFDRAVELVNRALDDPAAGDMEKQRAYIILCKVSLASDEPEPAKNYVIKILEIDPAYQPTIEEETPQFVNFVSQIRTRYARPVKKSDRKGLMKWMAVGAGAIITATVVAVMASGTNKTDKPPENTLPEPPAFP